MGNPKVVIITINYNQNNYTIDCIKSIFRSDYSNFNLILIDNGSSENNVIDLKMRIPKNERIKFHSISPNRGYVGGINYGLKEGSKLKPDYFLIMNNDTIIAENTISELIKTSLKYSDNAIVTGKTYEYDSNILQYIGESLVDVRFLKFKRIGSGEEDHGQYDDDIERDMIDDIFWLLPQKVFCRIGFYTDLFCFNGESADYALRAFNNGFKLVYSHKAKIWHKGSVSIDGRKRNPAKAFLVMQSKMLLRSIHLKKKYYWIFVIKVIGEILATYASEFFRSIRGKSHNFSYPTAKIKGFLSVFKIQFSNENPGTNPYIN